MRTTCIVGIAVIAAWTGLGAQDQLRAAKDLYASAAYEDALATLSRMDGGSSAPDIARQVDQYRAFSLYALGRTKEAETIAESMIRKDPMARLDSVDASPRLEQMFTDVRKRLLPSLIRERLRTARSALDQKSFDTAKPPLTEAKLMVADAEKLGVKDDGLGDLSVLIDGFLQLVRFESERRPSAQPVSAASSGGTSVPAIGPSPTAPPPAASSIATPPAARAASQPVAGQGPAPRSAVSPVEVPAAAPPPPPTSLPVEVPAAPAPTTAARPNSKLTAAASAGSPRVYSIDDEGVSPPVAVDQRMPAISGQMSVVIKGLRTNGLVDILIDESGRVLDATIRRSLNSSFDALVVQSARRWKYQPAMKDGVPVRYVKTLLLVP